MSCTARATRLGSEMRFHAHTMRNCTRCDPTGASDMEGEAVEAGPLPSQQAEPARANGTVINGSVTNGTHEELAEDDDEETDDMNELSGGKKKEEEKQRCISLREDDAGNLCSNRMDDACLSLNSTVVQLPFILPSLTSFVRLSKCPLAPVVDRKDLLVRR